MPLFQSKQYGLKVVHEPSNTVTSEKWFNTELERNSAMAGSTMERDYIYVVEEKEIEAPQQNMTNAEALRDALRAIKDALEEYSGGYNNPEAKRLIEDQLFRITSRVQHGTLEVANFRTRLDEFYSPRKWQHWGTIDDARVEVLQALNSLSIAVQRTS